MDFGRYRSPPIPSSLLNPFGPPRTVSNSFFPFSVAGSPESSKRSTRSIRLTRDIDIGEKGRRGWSWKNRAGDDIDDTRVPRDRALYAPWKTLDAIVGIVVSPVRLECRLPACFCSLRLSSRRVGRHFRDSPPERVDRPIGISDLSARSDNDGDDEDGDAGGFFSVA